MNGLIYGLKRRSDPEQLTEGNHSIRWRQESLAQENLRDLINR